MPMRSSLASWSSRRAHELLVANSTRSPRVRRRSTAAAAPSIGCSANQTTPSRSSTHAMTRSVSGVASAVCQDGRVARFQPFPGIRYDLTRVGLSNVVSPPYDVIDDAERAELAARSPYNAVRVDLPADEGGGGDDRYTVARRLFAGWRADGVLVDDARPSFTVYRMSYVDDSGVDRHTTGVI